LYSNIKLVSFGSTYSFVTGEVLELNTKKDLTIIALLVEVNPDEEVALGRSR
jgi:hypothetical protein